jgi:hypothetical protein
MTIRLIFSLVVLILSSLVLTVAGKWLFDQILEAEIRSMP